MTVGRVIDRYVIEAELGSGGFGAVYRAKHSIIGTPVALKVLSPEHARDATMVQRFLREAKTAAGIGNPHIVGVSDAGVTPDGCPFLAMEVLEGEDLEHRILGAGALPMWGAIDVVLQTLEALGAAHAAGIVHRDMKPANIFLIRGPDGKPFAKLLDFGISKVVEPGKISSLTQTGTMLGTPAYMAPEQFQNTAGVDHRADLYAVAAILYESLTGRLPYPAETFSDLMERFQGRQPSRLSEALPSAPPALTALIDRGLSREPNARFADAQEMANALRAIQSQLPEQSFEVRVAPAPPSQPLAQQPTPQLGQLPTPSPLPQGIGPGAALPSAGGWSQQYAPTHNAPGVPPTAGHAQMPGYGSSTAASHLGAAPSEGPSLALWIGLGFLAIVLPLACLGGGVLAFNLSEDEPSQPTASTTPPAVRPIVRPSIPPPSRPIPTPTPTPTPLPPSFTPVPPDEPLIAATVPEGAEPCAVPLDLNVSCDRDWDHREPATCETTRGRELIVVAAYSPAGPQGRVFVDVGRTVAPIVLVLSAYAQTTWTLRVAEGAQIDEIVTVGMNPSTVEGAPEGARVRTVPRRRSRYPIMGWEWEGGSWSGEETTRQAERDTGLSARTWVGCYAPSRFLIGQLAPE